MGEIEAITFKLDITFFYELLMATFRRFLFCSKDLNLKKLLLTICKVDKKNINFSFEMEKDGQIPFLDVNVLRENGKFVTNVYRKETFAGVYTNFSSFITLKHKFGLVYNY